MSGVKKVSPAVLALMALLTSCAFGARSINWLHDLGPEIGGGGTGIVTWNGQNAKDWSVVMYEDGGDGVISGLESVGGETVSRGDDTALAQTTITLMYGTDSSLMFFYTGLSIEPGKRVFTVVFNGTDRNSASHYLTIDSGLFTIPAGSPISPPADYNAGSASAWESLSSGGTGLTLEIVSAHGTASPPVGIYTNDPGAIVVNSVTSPDTQGTTRYVCTGWSMSGNEPGSGTATTMTMTHSNDAVLAWLWAANYRLDVASVGNGSVDQGDQWVGAGSNVTIVATAQPGNHFDFWSGDTNGCTLSDNRIIVAMDRPRAITANFAVDPPPPDLEIAATAGPHGAIDPSGVVVVPHGGSQAFAITADPHYHVADVVVDSVSVGPVGSYTFNDVTSDHTIHAGFSIDRHTLEIVSAHGVAELPVGIHTNDYGSVLTNTVVSPDVRGVTQYVCVAGVVTGNEFTQLQPTNVTLVLTNDAVLAWQWETNYWLDVGSVADGSVDQDDQWVGAGGSIALTATAGADHHFDFWSGDTNGCTLIDNQIVVVMDRPRQIVANFAPDAPPPDLEIAATAGAHGAIDPSGVVTVAHGGSQAFAITADPHYHVADVAVDSVSMGPLDSYAFNNVVADHTIHASFAIDRHTLEIVSAHGTAEPPIGLYTNAYGSKLTNTVVSPDTQGAKQYVCVAGTVAGNDFVQLQPTNVTLTLTNDAVLTWEWQTRYWMDVAAGPNGSVDMTSGWVNAGSIVLLTATPNAHYHLESWSGDTDGCTVAGNSIIVPPMDRPRQLTANFAIDVHTLEIVSAHGIAAPPVGTHSGEYGTELDASVVSPDVQGTTRYVSTGWRMSGNDPAAGTETSLTMTLTNDAVLTWEWQTQYQVDTEAGPEGSVDVEDQWVDAGDSITITATPDAHHHLVGWSGDTNGCTIAGNRIVAPMDQARQLTANFAIDMHTLEVVSAHGTATPPVGIHAANYGSSLANSVASPDTQDTTRYVCTGWNMSGNDPAAGTEDSMNMVLTNDAVLTWQWKTQYLLDTEAGPNGGVDVSDQWVDAGGSVTITATADAHYHFVAWSGDTNGCTISDNTITAPMGQARQIGAGFAVDRHTLEIASAHGTAAPPVGSHVRDYGSVMVNTVASPDTQGATRYVCTGWSMSGNGPAAGAEASMTMTLTNDAALTWQWRTQYLLDSEAGAGGSVDVADTWVDAGSNITVTATADPHYHFSGWSGDTNGCSISSNQITVVMDGSREIYAAFEKDAVILTGLSLDGPAAVSAGGSASYVATAEYSDESSSNVSAVAEWMVAGSAPSGTVIDAGELTAGMVTSNVSVLIEAVYVELDVTLTGRFDVAIVPVGATGSGWHYVGKDLAGTRCDPDGSSVPTDTNLVERFKVPRCWRGNILTGDVDGDGALEIVNVNRNRLLIYDGSGNLQTNVTLSGGRWAGHELSMLADADGDGVLDIGIGRGGGWGPARAEFYDGTGTLLKSIEHEDCGWWWMSRAIRPRALLADGNVAVETEYGPAVYDGGTGSNVWSYWAGRPHRITSIADFDGDGKLEFAGAAGSGDTEMTVVDEDGNEELWKHFSGRGRRDHSFVDLDGDGAMELLCFEDTNRGPSLWHRGWWHRGRRRSSGIRLYDQAGSVLAEWKGRHRDVTWHHAVADLDNDGDMEVIATAGHRKYGASTLHVLDHELQLVADKPVDGHVQLVCDLTGDGRKDIVLLSKGGMLTVLDADLAVIDSRRVGRSRWWHRDGQVISSDIDGDGIVELICRTDQLCAVAFGGGSASGEPGGGGDDVIDEPSWDTDMDGMSDDGEMLAGTDPFDTDSVFEITGLERVDDSGMAPTSKDKRGGDDAEVLVVRWRSVTGKTYSVWCATSLIEGFSVVESNIVATPPENAHRTVVPVGAKSVYYRVTMEQP